MTIAPIVGGRYAMWRMCFLVLFLACASLGGAAAQNASAGGDAGLAADRAKSNALTPEQSEQAQKLFETAFGLLSSGDLEAAKLGFERGLAIDPANATANFYMAETLVRLHDNERARTYYDKVIAIDPNSAEALKAQVALGNLPATPTAMLDPEVLKTDAAYRVVLFVAADSPIKTVAEAVAYIKANSKTVGLGCTRPQACGVAERFRKFVGLDNEAIPYRGAFQVMSDLSDPHTEVIFGFLPMTAVLQLIKEGKIRVIAVTGPQRSVNMPQIPTMLESGISGL